MTTNNIITPTNLLTVSLKSEFIEYINNKNFKCVNYGDNNTWITNKNNLEKYLMICNHFGLINKLRDVIDDELDPIDIIYTYLSNTINNCMPEIIDDTFHVSKIAECLTINTKEGYYKLTEEDNNTTNIDIIAIDNSNNYNINNIDKNNDNNYNINNSNINNKKVNKLVGTNNQTEFNISFNSNQFLSNFRNENNIMNTNLSKVITELLKESNLFDNLYTDNEIDNSNTNYKMNINIVDNYNINNKKNTNIDGNYDDKNNVNNSRINKSKSNDSLNNDIERKILAIKINILSLKHNNKSYSIYYGHLFESLMVDIMEYLINNDINIFNSINNKITNNNVNYKINNFTNSHDVYISNDFDDGVAILNKLINELEKEDDESKFNNSSHYVVGYNNVINKLTIYFDDSNNTSDVCGIYLYNGLNSIVNEYVKHDNLTKENLLEIYNFIRELINEFHEQELGLINYIILFKYYIQFILTNQLKELIFTYIPNKFDGKVVNIIPKPRFDYGIVNGEGDFIIVVKKHDTNENNSKENKQSINNKQLINNRENITLNKQTITNNTQTTNTDNLIYILADAKCYTSIKENEILKFSYQLIGYNQLHEHNKVIPSYRRQHNYSFDAFMIINPLNEINRTLTFYSVDLNEYNNDVDILADNFERYLQKCITYKEIIISKSR